jgi:pyruvate ferredoxin oxidoreductase gamma subunit/2-oxoisovalerate ferredoxin oxidoreductase gamma subunit
MWSCWTRASSRRWTSPRASRRRGRILINSERPPEDYPDLASRFEVATVDAGAIARRHRLGSMTQPIVNTAIVGACAAFLGIVALDSVCRTIAAEIPVRAEDNIAAAREAAAALRLGRPLGVRHG